MAQGFWVSRWHGAGTQEEPFVPILATVMQVDGWVDRANGFAAAEGNMALIMAVPALVRQRANQAVQAAETALATTDYPAMLNGLPALESRLIDLWQACQQVGTPTPVPMPDLRWKAIDLRGDSSTVGGYCLVWTARAKAAWHNPLNEPGEQISVYGLGTSKNDVLPDGFIDYVNARLGATVPYGRTVRDLARWIMRRDLPPARRLRAGRNGRYTIHLDDQADDFTDADVT